MNDKPTGSQGAESLPIIAGCRHCDAARAELERCADGSGGFSSGRGGLAWGTGPVVQLHDPLADKIFRSGGSCSCECHDIWRFVQKGAVR